MAESALPGASLPVLRPSPYCIMATLDRREECAFTYVYMPTRGLGLRSRSMGILLHIPCCMSAVHYKGVK